MTRPYKRVAAIGAIAFVCAVIAYPCAFAFWLYWTAVKLPVQPERPVIRTGTISADGWKFKIVKVFNFHRRGVRLLKFLPLSRQIFVAFRDKGDDGVFQWDVDTGELVRACDLGRGYGPLDSARPGTNLWDVPLSKSNLTNYGVFYRSSSGATNLITKDYWVSNYCTSKDGRLILVATWNDDIIIWDTVAGKQIARQRITNHHNGAGYVVYDEAKDRFLIADPSSHGVKYLRALITIKRPTSDFSASLTSPPKEYGQQER